MVLGKVLIVSGIVDFARGSYSRNIRNRIVRNNGVAVTEMM